MTFFCFTIFGEVVMRTTFCRGFAVAVGSTLGAMDMQPVSPAKAPDRTVAINACFTALPTIASLWIKTSPDADWLAPRLLWPC